jgi:ribose/xylose/arabinose/galactoside ABC-type transport system permease subunit
MLFVIFTGGIDLSVGSLMALGGAVASWLIVNKDINFIPAVFAALLVGLSGGMVTGILVAYFRFQGFVASLAIMTMARGMALVVTNGSPIRVDDNTLSNLASPRYGYPMLVIAVTLVLLFVFVQKYTSYGRIVIAIGSNRQAVELAGIRVKRYLTSVYMISGVLSALCGCFVAARTSTGTGTMGEGQELDAIAACVIGGASLGAKQKSIIDRCTASVYRYYQQGNYMGTPPTLQDFREELLKQDEPEAQEIALAIELFTDGSLNTFAKHTNVDTHSRLICYDILDLGKQLQPIGMLVVLDSILNRITQNRAKGRNTFIFIDEIYLLFQHEYSANFLFTLWKRVRKYGAYCTGITQNVDDLLQSHTARTMLANSEFIIMLNQASTDRIELAKLLNISDLQMSYITNVGAGQGLLKVGSSLVPFVNKFPRNTELYKLMTTKFGEC